MNELPSKGKWIVEYTVDYEEVELLKKPIAIEKLEILNHDDIDWYDDSGNKSSNVDHQYNIDDYTFYKITYECVCLSDELNDEIESYVETMYVYTDVYIKHDVCRFENAIKDIAFILNDILLGFCELFFVKMVFFLEFTCVFALWYSDLFGVMWIPCYIILLGVGLEIYTENWK